MHAVGAFMGDAMRPQHLPKAFVRALSQQVFVQLAQHGAEGEGILPFPFGAEPLRAQPIADLAGQDRRPDPAVLMHKVHRLSGLAGQRPDGLCPRHEGRQHPARVPLVQAQHGERIAMPPLGQRLRRAFVDQIAHLGLPSPKGRAVGHSAGVTSQTSVM